MEIHRLFEFATDHIRPGQLHSTHRTRRDVDDAHTACHFRHVVDRQRQFSSAGSRAPVASRSRYCPDACRAPSHANPRATTHV